MFNQILLLNTLILGDVSPFYRTISDSTSVGETLANSMTAQLTLEEVLTLAAALSYQGAEYFEVLAELLTLDGADVTQMAATLADLLTLDGVVGGNKGAMRQILETLTLWETQRLGFLKTNSETLTISESQVANVGKLIADYFRASEQVVVNWHGGLTLADRFLLFDTPTAAQGFLKALADVVTNSDTIVAALGINLRDQIRASDSVAGAWQGIKTILEVLTATDQTTIAKGYGEALADVLTLTDNPLLLFAAACIAADTLSVTDAATSAKVADGRLTSTLTITESVTPRANMKGVLTDTVTFDFKATLDGEVYQCWSFTTSEMHPSLFTNYDFNSYANVGAETYAAKSAGIYLLGGTTDAGAKIETGVKLNFGNMGTHYQKRLYYADFGLVGEAPALRVTTATGSTDYYVANGKAKLGMGAHGRDWELILTDIDALDFVEIAPVILSR